MKPKLGKAAFNILSGLYSFPVQNYRERGTLYPVVVMGRFALGWEVGVTDDRGYQTRDKFRTRAEAVAHIEGTDAYEEVAA